MRKVRGSATVEMAYIMPVVFMTIIAVIYIMFYFHDKNILTGAGYETVVVGSQKMKWDEENVEELLTNLFYERVGRKMILFTYADVEITCEEDEIILRAKAEKRRMRIETEQKMKVTEPEKFIRNIRRIHGAEI